MSVPAWLQITQAISGIGVAVGGAAWVLFILYPYLKWTRAIMLKSYELGSRTADHLEKLQSELAPILSDLKKVVGDAHGLLSELRGNDLDDTLKAVREIPAKLEDLLKAGKKDLLKNL